MNRETLAGVLPGVVANASDVICLVGVFPPGVLAKNDDEDLSALLLPPPGVFPAPPPSSGDVTLWSALGLLFQRFGVLPGVFPPGVLTRPGVFRMPRPGVRISFAGY